MSERGADHSLDERIDLTAVDGELPDVPAEVHDRLLRRIEATLGIPGPGAPDPAGGAGSGAGGGSAAGAGAGAAAGAGGSIAPGAFTVTGWAGMGTAAALGTVLVAAFFVVRATMVQPPLRANSGAGSAALGAAPAQPASAPSEPLGAQEPSPSPAPVSSGDNRAGAPTSSAARDLDLAREHALLETARSAVARGQGAAALASLEQHARSFPSGRLSQEREVLTIQALMQTGRHADARARGERFRRRFPKSMLLPVVDAALGTNP